VDLESKYSLGVASYRGLRDVINEHRNPPIVKDGGISMVESIGILWNHVRRELIEMNRIARATSMSASI